MNDLISVMIAVYNGEKYLDRCIESVINQTYKNFELILVDDGSTDNTWEIFQKYAQKDNRIKCVQKKNGGLSSARNYGMKNAKGKYYYFLDCDDYIKENLLETVYNKMLETEADLVAFNYIKFNEKGRIIGSSNFETGEYDVDTDRAKFDYLNNILLQYKTGWEDWNRLYRADIIKNNHLKFLDYHLYFAQDLCFHLFYIMHAKKVVCIPTKLHYYMIRNDSIMRTAGKQIGLDFLIHIMKKFYDYIDIKKYPYMKQNFHYLLSTILIRQLNEIHDKKLMRYYLKKVYYKDFLKEQMIKIVRNPIIGINTWKVAVFVLKNLEVVNEKTIKDRISFLKLEKYLKKKEPKIILLGSEDFGNLGDHQIAVSEINFLKNFFIDIPIYELPASKYFKYIDKLQKYIGPEDIICGTGGGNLGSEYLYSETIRRDFIKRFPNNKIIIFPQTIYFKNSSNGRKELKITQMIYNKHKSLYLMVREEDSYQFAKKYLFCKIFRVPDIVFYSDYSKESSFRSGILLCLRKDKESILNGKQKEKIIKTVTNLTKNVKVIDHQLQENIPVSKRAKVVTDMIQEYQKAELVITDRLHGMIFCAITKTPCIVLSNYNYKVKGVYKWIEHLDYICYLEKSELDKIEVIMKKLMIRKRRFYKNTKLLIQFNRIGNLLTTAFLGGKTW